MTWTIKEHIKASRRTFIMVATISFLPIALMAFSLMLHVANRDRENFNIVIDGVLYNRSMTERQCIYVMDFWIKANRGVVVFCEKED
jgi:hypothetical protein